mgnify:CR=1 FL=1
MSKLQIKSKEEYKRIFDELEQRYGNLDLEKVTQEILNEIEEFSRLSFGNTYFNGMTFDKNHFDDDYFYRVRVHNEKEPIDENAIESYRYLPSDNFRLNRLTCAGNQGMYTSIGYFTPIIESKKDIILGESRVYISKWKMKADVPLLTVFYLFWQFQSDEENCEIKDFEDWFRTSVTNNIPITEDKKESFIYFHERFNKIIIEPSQKYYPISAGICSKLLQNKVYMGRNEECYPIICYPSVAYKGKGINYVFPKDFVDNYMELVEVEKIIVNEINGDNVSLTHLAKFLVEHNDVKSNFVTKHYGINSTIPNGNIQLHLEDNLNVFTKVPFEKNLLTHHCKKCAFSPRKFFEHQDTENNFKQSIHSSKIPLIPSYDHNGTTSLYMIMEAINNQEEGLYYLDKSGNKKRVLRLLYEVDVNWGLTG